MVKLSKDEEDLFKFLVNKAYEEGNKKVIQYLASQLHKTVKGKRTSKLVTSKLEEYCEDEDPLFAGLASTALFYHNEDASFVKELEYGGLGLVSKDLETSKKIAGYYDKKQMHYTNLLEKIIMTENDPTIVTFVGGPDSFKKSNVNRTVTALRWYDKNREDTEFNHGGNGETPSTDGHINKDGAYKHLNDQVLSGLIEDEREYMEDNLFDDVIKMLE